MRRFIALLVVALASWLPISPLQAQVTSYAAGIQVQTPCRVPGTPKTLSCVVFDKRLSGNSPAPTLTLDPSITVAKESPQNYTVVYAVSIRPGGLNQNSGITITHGKDLLDADLYGIRPRFFWITTHDAGKHWSQIQTDHMDTILHS